MNIVRAAEGLFKDSDSAICSLNSNLRRLLHYRLEVLEGALLRLAELRGEAANALESCGELVQHKLAPQSKIKRYIQPFGNTWMPVLPEWCRSSCCIQLLK